MREIVAELDPLATTDRVATMEQIVSNAVVRPRFYAVTLGAFAGVAGLLAAIGIYGVTAYAVRQRVREIGIRMALGAQAGAMVLLVLRQGLGLTALGIVLGIIGALLSTRYLQTMLFGLTAMDPMSYGLAAIVFGSIASIACYVPARRAVDANPVVALRHE